LTAYVTYVTFNLVMAEQEQKTNKIPVGTNVDPALYAVLDQFRTEEDRPMSNMVERLLKTHPRIEPLLETETSGATA